VKGPVNVEVTGTMAEEVVKEARMMAAWGDEIVIKIPITPEGLKAVKSLSSEGIRTNVTLLFSPAQAILAAKAGATYICPFLGRLDDIGFYGLDLIQQIRGIYDNYDDIKTQITSPPAIIEQMVKHPLTDKGIAQFLEDAKKIGVKK
jgi:transaldolase